MEPIYYRVGNDSTISGYNEIRYRKGSDIDKAKARALRAAKRLADQLLPIGNCRLSIYDKDFEYLETTTYTIK